MARGPIVAKVYTGRAKEINDKIEAMKVEIKNLQEELKVAYKEQLNSEKAAKKAQAKKDEEEVLKAIRKSGKSKDEILQLLGTTEEQVEAEE